jgi:hypothetical protein
MDRVSVTIKAFIDVLCIKKNRVPHKQVVLFLAKLLDMTKIFEEECTSKEERLLQKLLSNVLKQESNLRGAGGVDLLVSSMEVVDLLLNRLMKQVNLIRKLQAERDHFLAEIDGLHAIVDSMFASEIILSTGTEEPASGQVIDFQVVLSSTNYIMHYISHHRDFSSLVIVVLWKSEFPGPAICHDGMPLLYVHHASTSVENFVDWSDFPLGDSLLPRREYTASELQDSVRVKQVIAQHQKPLFGLHSNLVAIRL